MTKISKADQIYNYTAHKLYYLHSLTETGFWKGKLANLRHGVGKKPGELPELWGFIFDGVPEELFGHKSNGASYAEWAVYTALTLYALHQQGNTVYVNEKGVSLGKAAANLVKNEEGSEERIAKRLHLVATSTSQNDLAYYLRGVVQLLKAEPIPLDYARLAKEIYSMNFEESSKNIVLSWGREFYGALYERKGKEGETNGQ